MISNNIVYHPHKLTKECVEGIIGNSTDVGRGKKILGRRNKEATLYRIKFMENCIKEGLVQKLHIPTAVRTIDSLKAML